MTCSTGPTLEDAFAQIVALRAEAAEARRWRTWAEPLIARLEPKPRMTPERAALLLALARRMRRPGEVFSTTNLLSVAAGDAGFAALVGAVAAPGLSQGKRLGKALQRMAGVPAHGLMLRRLDADEGGSALWTVELAPGGEWPAALPAGPLLTGRPVRHSPG